MELTRIEVHDVEPGVVRLEVEVPVHEIQNVMRSVCQELRQVVRVPGFRAGHAPLQIIRRQVGEDVVNRHALERIVPTAFEEAVRQKELQPVTTPEFEFEALSEQSPFEIRASIALKPGVVLGNYQNLNVESSKVEIKDTDVDQELENLQRRLATYEENEDRVAEKGDQVKINYRIEIADESDDQDAAEELEMTVVAGEGEWFPPVHEHLEGKQSGDSGEFEVSYPDDFANEKIRGKSAKVSFTLSSVAIRTLPELNDEFARNMTGDGSVDALKESLRSHLLTHSEQVADRELRKQIEDALLASCETVVPNLVQQRFVEEAMRDLDGAARARETTIEALLQAEGKTEDEYRSELNRTGDRTLKLRFIVDAIAEQEDINVVDEEIVEEAGRRFEKTKFTSDEQRDNALRALGRHMFEEKVMQFLSESARMSVAESDTDAELEKSESEESE